MQTYNDTTKAEMHVTVIGIFLSFFATVTYVIITYILAVQSKEAITLSNKAIEQSKKEQQIRDIENRLEKFYIPADEIINLQNRLKETTIDGYVHNKNGQFVPGLKSLRKYSYLADKKTYEAYDRYLKTGCTTAKNDTCKLDNVFNKCNHKNETFTGDLERAQLLGIDNNSKYCRNRNAECPYNLNYCEYNPKCEKYQPDKVKKDTTYLNCTSDNTKCKYYIDLKEKITTDIENYKEELLRLKT